MDMADPFGWHDVDKTTLQYIRMKLAEIEQRTWQEILLVSATHNHVVKVDGLCRMAKDRLTSMRLDDVDELLSLRLAAKERVWGILSDGICTLIWWDPSHEVYPSLLKHT